MSVVAPGFRLFRLLASVLLIAAAHSVAAEVALPEFEMRHAVEHDWAQQERRWGRAPESPEAIAAAVLRSEKLLRYWRECQPASILAASDVELSDLRRQSVQP